MATQLEFSTALDDPQAMDLELIVRDPETIAELAKHTAGEERNRFALMALRIGVLAVSQAQGTMDAQQVRAESDRLLEQIQTRLSDHAQTTHYRLKDLLARYFDPESGQFLERIDSLLSNDGRLATLLEKKIGQGDSELSRMLVQHFGKDSQLMQLLDPEQSQGLMSHFGRLMDTQLGDQRQKVLEQFSLDNETSALSRLVAQLNAHQGQLTTRLQGQIDGVVEQFSLDREDSALSKLVKNVERAQKTITNEFSLDEQGSALARMKRELTHMLDGLQERNQKFQEEIKSTLTALVARKEESKRSTRHGLEFEDAVYQWLQHEVPPAGDIVERLGTKTGLIKGRKVGDFVIQLGPENIAAGARIVCESKQKENYTLAEARQELDEAKKNRDAQVGMFVFSRQSAAQPIDPLQRVGSDVFCVWDAEDSNTDVYLKSALTIARALCVSQTRDISEEVDLGQLERAVLQIEKRTLKFEQMESWTETIRSNSHKLQKALVISRRDLHDQVEHLHRVLDQLKQSD